MGQCIQEWTKQNVWKKAFKKIEVIWSADKTASQSNEKYMSVLKHPHPCWCSRVNRCWCFNTEIYFSFDWDAVLSADHVITSNFLKTIFHKFYLVHSRILCPTY